MKFLPGKKTLPKELKTILAFTFIFSLINLLVFSLIFRFSLKTILANLASENAQLKLLSEELEKRNEEYKEIRTANDIKLFRQLIALRRDIANTLNDGEKILGAESQDASSSAKMRRSRTGSASTRCGRSSSPSSGSGRPS